MQSAPLDPIPGPDAALSAATAALEGLPLAVLVVDQDGRIVFAKIAWRF